MKVYCQTPKACFPRICTGIPRSEKRSRCNAATSGGIFEGISPKVGTSSQVGASKSGLTQPGSRRASQFCDSAIMQTGQRVVIEIHSILRASNTSAILRRSMAVRQIDPLAACVDADTFLCWGGGLPYFRDTLFPHFWGKPFPNKLGNKKAGIYSPAYRLVRVCA